MEGTTMIKSVHKNIAKTCRELVRFGLSLCDNWNADLTMNQVIILMTVAANEGISIQDLVKETGRVHSNVCRNLQTLGLHTIKPTKAHQGPAGARTKTGQRDCLHHSRLRPG
jgi:hypothetical protein